MATSYGSRVYGLSTRNVAQNEYVKSGVVYEANYTVSGIRTVVPGWEYDALDQVRDTIESKGGQIVYIGITGTDITVQWKHPSTATSTNAKAALAPVVVYGIVVAVSIVLAIWLVVTITGSVKEINTVMNDSPLTSVAIYGVIGVLGIFAFGYLMKQYRSKG